MNGVLSGGSFLNLKALFQGLRNSPNPQKAIPQVSQTKTFQVFNPEINPGGKSIATFAGQATATALTNMFANVKFFVSMNRNKSRRTSPPSPPQGGTVPFFEETKRAIYGTVELQFNGLQLHRTGVRRYLPARALSPLEGGWGVNIGALKQLSLLFFLAIFFLSACAPKRTNTEPPATQVSNTEEIIEKKITTGAEQTDLYLNKIKNKNIALAVNQTSMIGETHLVDSLLKLDISIKKIFAPEHGFRGEADAGEQIKDGIDVQTGVPVISLYGNKKKPTTDDLKNIDFIIFDIQDVGARFYTYISSMSYLMEAAAENNIPFMILDRPNPNGHYVDGPLRKKGFESFVGLHEVPVVHGMTVGEYAQMVNGEGWLKNNIICELEIIRCENYNHISFYELPVKPSPNLPNIRSIYLYPSICFFEGTEVSVGRGTDKQFQVLGAPNFPKGDYEFTPVPKPGATSPKHEGKLCRGYNLTTIDLNKIKNQKKLDLSYLIDFYTHYEPKKEFFLKNNFIDKLAGSDELRKQIIAGKSAEEIREGWQKDLEAFKLIRKKYLLYGDFE